MDEREAAPEGFMDWWNQNWPDLCPTHQALHAWQAALDSQAARTDKLEVLLRKMIEVFDEDGIDYTPRHKMPSMIGEADYLVNGAGRALAAGEKEGKTQK